MVKCDKCYLRKLHISICKTKIFVLTVTISQFWVKQHARCTDNRLRLLCQSIPPSQFLRMYAQNLLNAWDILCEQFSGLHVDWQNNMASMTIQPPTISCMPSNFKVINSLAKMSLVKEEWRLDLKAKMKLSQPSPFHS